MPPRRRTKREESVSDAISSNITRILEGLLKDYDKTERPGFKTGKCGRQSLNVEICYNVELKGLSRVARIELESSAIGQ